MMRSTADHRMMETKRYRIYRVSIVRSALSVWGVGYFIGFPILGIMHLFASFGTRPNYQPLQLVQIIIIPLIVSLIFLVLAVVGSFAYNIFAKFGVAIEVQLKDVGDV